WSADGAGPASDRYALGVIAFELLSGALPFSAASVPGMMEQHFRAKIPALSMRGSTSSAVDEVMQRALAKDPDARHRTAHELVEALRSAAGTAAGRVSIEPEPRPRRALYGVLGVGTLGVCIVGGALALTGKDHPPPAIAPAESPPAADTIAIDISSTPDGATIALAGKPVGATPRTVRVARGAHVELVASKPGYLPSHRAFDAGTADSQLAINLGAVSRFEGVWKLPNGELRAFERTDERVAISKLTSVHGRRELWKFYPFVPADHGVAFALDDEVIDPRAPDAPSCHVAVHVEYRYDAATDALELHRPTVKLDFVDGQCVPRSQEVAPQRLVRVDAPRDSVEIEAPAGGPKNGDGGKTSKPVPKFPTAPSAKTKKAALPTKSVVPYDPTSKVQSKAAPNAPSSAQNEPFQGNQQIMAPPKATPKPVEVGVPQQQAAVRK
ncbi:MAG: PEGA domain-containing protein, partial [Kofleriaceae bacterium]